MKRLYLSVGQRDHQDGAPDAPAVLVEYGDFECPYCGQAYPIVNRIREEMGTGLLFVFRHFPLTTVHPHAESAALAAEAGGAQGKFWEMHAALFRHQEELKEATLDGLADAIGLDRGEYDRDMATRRYLPRIKEDVYSGVRSGVNGTPCFFINGLRYDGSWQFSSLLSAVRTAANSTTRT
jgi:protein-disulfide isomerase